MRTAVVLLILLAAPAGASVVRPDRPTLPTELRKAVVTPRPELKEGELLITPATEIWLDGKRAKLTDVPDGCEITELSVNARKEVLVIKFKTPKGK